MKAQAVSKSVPVSPRKVRYIADTIRGASIEQALTTLSMVSRRGATPLIKTIESAVANAVNNAQADKSALKLLAVDIMEGPSLKRFHPATRGRVYPYKKRMTHIRIIVGDNK